MINEFHQERIKFITFGRSQQNTSREAFLDLRRAEPRTNASELITRA
jgi:hypothetical protein